MSRQQQREERKQQREERKQQRKQQRQQRLNGVKSHHNKRRLNSKKEMDEALNLINSFWDGDLTNDQKNERKQQENVYKLNHQMRLNEILLNQIRNVQQRKNYTSNHTQTVPNARKCNETCNGARTDNGKNTACCVISGGGMVHIKGIGKRKIHRYKNGNKYVIVKGVKKSLNKFH